MSIALSATVKPSRLLLFAAVCMCVVSVSLSSYGILQTSLNLAFKSLMIFVLMAVVIVRFVQFVRKRSSIRLDISDSGRIILRRVSQGNDSGLSDVVRMTEATTLWPNLMLLHLQSEGGRGPQIHVVPILPDCVDSQTWRKLSLALRWIAIHQQTQKNTVSQSGNF